jgi:hypothetical protein
MFLESFAKHIYRVDQSAVCGQKRRTPANDVLQAFQFQAFPTTLFPSFGRPVSA